MAQTFLGQKRIRRYYGKIREVLEMPNLIEVQKSSYDDFLMVKEPAGGRPDYGLQSVFRSVFPISDFSERATLEFVRSCGVPIRGNSNAQQMQLYFGSAYNKQPDRYGIRPIPRYRPSVYDSSTCVAFRTGPRMRTCSKTRRLTPIIRSKGR